MIEAALIFFGIAFGIAVGLIFALITFAVLSSINGIKETDEVEPTGDMVDISHFLNKFGDEK